LRPHLTSKKINGWWNRKQILILWIILNKKNKKMIKFERKINWCVALKIYRVRRVKWEEEKEKRKRKEKVANTKTKIPLPHVLHKNDGDAVKIQTLSWKSLTPKWHHTCCIDNTNKATLSHVNNTRINFLILNNILYMLKYQVAPMQHNKNKKKRLKGLKYRLR
jgi:hypothetical protein